MGAEDRGAIPPQVPPELLRSEIARLRALLAEHSIAWGRACWEMPTAAVAPATAAAAVMAGTGLASAVQPQSTEPAAFPAQGDGSLGSPPPQLTQAGQGSVSPVQHFRDSDNGTNIGDHRWLSPEDLNNRAHDSFHARMLLRFFRGRDDVYARRYQYQDRSGYYPVCQNYKRESCPRRNNPKYPCKNCTQRVNRPLGPEVLIEHLNGCDSNGREVVVGVYPLRKNDCCRFLVFDFDDHGPAKGRSKPGPGKNSAAKQALGADAEPGTSAEEQQTEKELAELYQAIAPTPWQEEVALFRQICHDNEVPCLVERSRSGNGAHVWIIFEGDVPAHLAREFGRRLLLRGAAQTKRRLFHFFDRMMPMQEHCSPGDLGNLIALPLQGQALRQGNSAFVDENWQAYPNQWQALCTTTRLKPSQVEEFLSLWQEGELSTLVEQQDEEPILEDEQEMVGRDASAALKLLPRNARALHLRPDGAPHGVKVILGGGLKIPMGELTGSFVNALRYLASMSNPKFYSNLRRGRSNFRVPRRLYFDVDEGDCLVLPRGLKEALEQKLDEAGIALEIRDERCAGHSIEVSFTGQLRPEQEPAAAAMLKHEDGVLKAATAFGKSVVGAYLIAQRKVSTLVLVTKLNILEQWRTSLGVNLDFGAAERTYTTRGGKTSKCQRNDFVGILSGNKYQLTHVVDVASIQSLTSKEEALELFGHYGMVIVDECHHEAAPTLFDLLRRVPCIYLYGLTANLARSDNLNRLPLMLLGPIRYHYSAKDQARDQKLPRRVRPRYTRTVSPRAEQLDNHGLLDLVMQDSQRSAQIAAEAAEYAKAGRFVLVLTLRVDHANLLHDLIKKRFPETYLLTGQSPDRAQLYRALATRDNPSFVLVSTSQYGGEGMDIPRLDTLLLAMPETNKLTQLTGRITRMHPEKRDLLVVDYVDGNVPIAAHMFSKRKRIYKQNGYTLEQVGREREFSQEPWSVPPLVAAFEGLPVGSVQEQGSVAQGSESAGAAAGMGQAGTTKDAVTEAIVDAPAGPAAAATASANTVAFFSDPQLFCQQLKADLLGARDAEFYLSSLSMTDLMLLWDLTAAAYTQGCKMTVVVNDDPDNDEHSKRVGLIKERGLYVGYANYLTADFIVVDQQVLWRGFTPLLGSRPSGEQVIREVNSDMVAAMRERTLNKVMR